MPLVRNLARLVPLAALLLAAVFIALAARADSASAKSACARFGHTQAKELRTAQARRSVRCLLNRKRVSRGLPKLHVNRGLERAAQRHTRIMERRRCFEHVCPGEASIAARLRDVRYLLSRLLRWAAGENIAWGGSRYSTPKNTVKRWMKSPPHRANILDPRFRDIGIGFVRGAPYAGERNAGMYTTDFGYRVR